MNPKFARAMIEYALKNSFPFLLKNALRNFQVQGFNSILLHKSEDLVLRLYVCEPGKSHLGNSLDQNDNVLWIHNHRFLFDSEVLVGWMANLLYSESAEQTEAGQWFKYGYKSALTANDGRMHLAEEGQVNLSLDSVQYVHEGDFYEMKPEALHKILVPEDQLVVMLFWERTKVQIDQKLYSRYALPESPDTAGTNQRFEEEDLRRILKVAIDALRERE